VISPVSGLQVPLEAQIALFVLVVICIQPGNLGRTP
jgi:hypothetical protein